MKLSKLYLPLLLSFLVGCAQPIKTTQNSQISDIKNEAKNGGAHVATGDENETIANSGPLENGLAVNEICLPEQEDETEVSLDGMPEESAEDNETVAEGLLDTDEPKGDQKVREKKPVIAKKSQPNLDEALELCQMAQELWQEGDLDSAIDVLDHAYSLVLRADTKDSPKLIQQTDDLRFMISKRILEIYASRHIVVSGNHNAIPIEINKHVQDEIDRFTSGKMDYFKRAYQRSGKYRPLIMEELGKAGLPTELSWLPLIESGYKNNALSPARALGLWQFIPSTGYKFGLNRDYYVDERMDPEKSTRAAIAYLGELHKIFGDWATVLAAYNCGEARVLKVIRDQNVNYLDNFWDLYERLPRETARYVPKFLATLHIVKNPEKYGLDFVDVCPPQTYETVMVSKQVHLKQIAEALGISETVLFELNPELRYKTLPKDEYSLKLPPGMGEQLIAKLESIPVTVAIAEQNQKVGKEKSGSAQYTVRSGDTLSSIAKRFHCEVKHIVRANGLSSKHYIVAGDKLKIPGKRKYSYREKKTFANSKSKTYTSKPSMRHVVKQGDSLWIIARQYGTTTEEIKELNNLSNGKLHIGQILKVNASAGSGYQSAKTRSGKTYLVKNGDVPSEIAKKHEMSLDKLFKINQMTANSKIYPGQTLFVK